MKTAVICGLTVFVGWVVLALIQLWFEWLTAEMFIKLSITAGMLLVLIVIVALALREYVTEQNLRDKDFLD